MAKYSTTEDVRVEFERRCMGRTQAEIAKEIGIPFQTVSIMLKGAPIGGKTLVWLGFERVTRYIKAGAK